MALEDGLVPRHLKRFPGRTGYLWIPTGSRAAALAGIALYPACRPLAIWGQKCIHLAVKLLGSRAIPGPASRWEPPMGGALWVSLCEEWRVQVGAFDSLVICGRRLPGPLGFSALLLHAGKPVGFAKTRPEESVRNEHDALVRVQDYGPGTFLAPRPLAVGGLSGWSYLVLSALPAGIHGRPRNPPISGIAREIRCALAGLPKPPDTPAHWEPMHGDLTSWNLRRTRKQGLFLLDWENTRWAPPGADEVYYRATEAGLTNAPPPELHAAEAIDYWLGIVSGWDENRGQRALVRNLGQMRKSCLAR